MLKPDALEKSRVGRIINAYEKNGWKIVNLTYKVPSRLVESHYSNYKNEEFYDKFIEHICSGPVIGLELEKNLGSIEGAREIMYDLRFHQCSI